MAADGRLPHRPVKKERRWKPLRFRIGRLAMVPAPADQLRRPGFGIPLGPGYALGAPVE